MRNTPNKICESAKPNTTDWKDIENKMFVKQDRLNDWLSKGAQPTDSVRRILVKLGIFKPETPTVKTASKKKDKKEN